MGDFLVHWSSLNWPYKPFLEPLEPWKRLYNEIDQISIYVHVKNRSFLERRYSQQKNVNNLENFQAKQVYLNSNRVQIFTNNTKPKILTFRPDTGKAMANRTRIIWQIQSYIFTNFSGSQLLSTI